MKFNLGEIYGLTRSLQKLVDKELPVKISFRLCRFLKSASVEMEALEKSRVQLVEKFAEPKEEGKEMKVSDENRESFQKEFAALLSEEVEIDFETFSIDDLGDISLSTNDLIPMQKLFKEN